MKTQEFISQYAGLKPASPKYCSSVVLDSNGVFYSYGSHYPLAFNIDGVWFINAAGYSSSTGRHINWAKQALPNYNVVKLIGADYSKENVIKSLEAERNELLEATKNGKEGSYLQSLRYKRLEENARWSFYLANVPF